MSEDLEGQTSAGFDIQRLLGIVRRRHMEFLIPLLFGWLLVWGASWVLPPRYKSVTTILVQQPTMPQNYVVPNINDDLQARLQSLKTQILSQTRLLKIIDRLNLYNGPENATTADERITQMRKDIDVELVRDPQRQDISAFTISYLARDPYVAQRVTGELTELFISENNKVRQEESEGTTSFLEKQLDDARASLSDQEAKVKQFESMHEGDLPTQQTSNLAIFAGLEQQLQNEQDALNTAKQQRVYLQAFLEQEKATQGRTRPVGTQTTEASAPTDLASVDEQLDKLKAQLADLSSRYTDKYPDVQNLKNQIAGLESVRDKLVAAAKAKGKNAKQQAGGATSNDDGDPVLSGPALQTQGQLQANQLEIDNREKAIASLKGRIGDYQSRLNAEPGTEQQLEELNRGYDQSKANYDDLLKKKEQSEMATSMEQMQQGERFTVLDPPTLPAKPDFPNRLKFCGAGFGVGLALGLVVAGGFEFMDDRMHSYEEIKRILPIAVVSEVPENVSAFDELKTKRRITIGWATTAIVFLTILAGSVFSYLRS
jgi:polysaccharide biosynthesis transport protein